VPARVLRDPGLYTAAGSALPPSSCSTAFALPHPDALSPTLLAPCGGRIIPGDMCIPSPAVLANWGGASGSGLLHF
jgi:hypothetical protein